MRGKDTRPYVYAQKSEKKDSCTVSIIWKIKNPQTVSFTAENTEQLSIKGTICNYFIPQSGWGSQCNESLCPWGGFKAPFVFILALNLTINDLWDLRAAAANWQYMCTLQYLTILMKHQLHQHHLHLYVCRCLHQYVLSLNTSLYHQHFMSSQVEYFANQGHRAIISLWARQSHRRAAPHYTAFCPRMSALCLAVKLFQVWGVHSCSLTAKTLNCHYTATYEESERSPTCRLNDGSCEITHMSCDVQVLHPERFLC